jgi:hypothetical protein
MYLFDDLIKRELRVVVFLADENISHSVSNEFE